MTAFENPDLHCHSIRSDGHLTPTELVARALANGVDLLALTDHDEIDGIDEALAAARGSPLRLLPGVEVSTSFGGETIHIVGLGIDHRQVGHRRGQHRRDAVAAAHLVALHPADLTN